MNSDRNNIVKSGFYSILQLVISTLSYAVVYLFIIGLLGKAQLGIWAMINSVPSSLIFFGSGVSGCMLRYFPIYNVNGCKKNLAKLLATGLIVNLFLAFIIVIVCLNFEIFILKFLFNLKIVPTVYFKIFRLTLVTFIFNFTSTVMLYSLDGLQLIKQRNIILIFGSLVFALIAIILLLYTGLIGLVYAQLCQAILIVIISIIYLNRTNLFFFRYLRFDFKIARLFLSFGRDLQLIAVFISCFEPITKYFLNRYFNLNLVGSYDVVNRLTNQIRLLIVGAIQVMVPVVTKKSLQTSFESQPLYTKAFRGALLLSGILYGLIFSISFTMPFFFKIALNSYLILLTYLSFAYVINIISVPAYSILMGLGKLKPILISHLLATLINVLLFLVFFKFISIYTILLPPLIAITLSSLYIIFTFQKKYIKNFAVFFKEDIWIHCSNILFPLSCVVTSIYYNHAILLLSVVLIHSLVVSLLVIKNSYMMYLASALFKK